MVHIVILLLAVTISLFGWQLVMASPRTLSRLIPHKVSFAIGLMLLILGVWGAFSGAFGLRQPEPVLHGIVGMYSGLWFMLASTAAARGSEDDMQFLRRLFLMVGMVILTIIGGLYAEDMRSMAVLNLLMITGGFWVVTNYMSLLDRGR